MRSMFLITCLLGASVAMAIESPSFQTLKKEDDCELRLYEPILLAETTVTGPFEDAGNLGFRKLADFIFGNNTNQSKIDMTAPVGQEAKGESIAMTAPVGLQKKDETFIVSFTMPRNYTLETIPKPRNPEVTLRQLPERRLAAIVYSGFWSESRYQEHLDTLRLWMRKQGLEAKGEPTFARYNPPWMPWFLRRNEILLEVASESVQKSGE